MIWLVNKAKDKYLNGGTKKIYGASRFDCPCSDYLWYLVSGYNLVIKE